ncbi:MAG: Uma2 family endonuclease [Acidobacteriota bacterium]
MSTLTKPPIPDEIVYPESDGKPIADNTEQYKWIVIIKENLDMLLENAFVAADLFWYPVQSEPKISQAPDVMVAIGRPKGRRSSYKQWEEDNIAPQVVFEILSRSNSPIDMFRKEKFYGRYGVQEYYIYDPDEKALVGYLRKEGGLQPIDNLSGWVSPLLKIRFEQLDGELEIFLPDGNRFVTFSDLTARAKAAEQRANRLAEKLRELGIDPESI